MFDVQRARPHNLNEYIGNGDNIKLFRSALKNGFSPFTIIVGPTGIGKTTISKILSKHLTCPNYFNGEPCDNCESCNDIDENLITRDKDTSNVMVFRMSDEGGKRAARKVIDQIKTRPLNGGTKVILLEECQGMSFEAQELMLPILEHIPEYVKIIACTTDSRALLDTFKGRANIYYFKQPTHEEVFGLLSRQIEKQGYTIDSPLVINSIIEIAGRTPRDCLQLFQKISTVGKEINLKEVIVHLNLMDELYYFEYLDCLKGDMGLVLDFIEKIENTHSTIQDFVKGLDAFLVKLVTFRYRKMVMSESVGLRAKKYLKETPEEDFLRIQQIVSDNHSLAVNHPNPKSALIALTFKLHKPKPIQFKSAEDTINTVNRTKENLANKHVAIERNNQNAEITQLSDNALLQGVNASIIRKPGSSNESN